MRRALLLLLAATPAWGQIPPELDRFVLEPQHRAAVLATARQEDAGIIAACATATVQAGEALTIFRPVQFDPAGKPTAGAWRERLRVVGCGQTRILNVLSLVRGPGQLAIGPLLAGDTQADPVLQRDSVRIAFAAASAAFSGCQDAAVIDTHYAGPEGAANPTLPLARRIPPWREDWTLRGCGKQIVLPLHFIPDATGTTIRASQPK